MSSKATCQCELSRENAEAEANSESETMADDVVGSSPNNMESIVAFHADSDYIVKCSNCEVSFCVPCDARDEKESYLRLIQNAEVLTDIKVDEVHGGDGYVEGPNAELTATDEECTPPVDAEDISVSGVSGV